VHITAAAFTGIKGPGSASGAGDAPPIVELPEMEEGAPGHG